MRRTRIRQSRYWVHWPDRINGRIRIYAWFPIQLFREKDVSCKRLSREQYESLSEGEILRILAQRRQYTPHYLDPFGRLLIPTELQLGRKVLFEENENFYRGVLQVSQKQSFQYFKKWLEGKKFGSKKNFTIREENLFYRAHVIPPPDLSQDQLINQTALYFYLSEYLSDLIVNSLYQAARTHGYKRLDFDIADPQKPGFRRSIQNIRSPSYIRPIFSIRLPKSSLLVLNGTFDYEYGVDVLADEASRYLVPSETLRLAAQTRPRGKSAQRR